MLVMPVVVWIQFSLMSHLCVGIQAPAGLDHLVSAVHSTILTHPPPGQNGRHFTDDMFKYIYFNENIWILNKISLKYVPWGLIDNMSALVQIMAWCHPGGKPLSEPMLTQLTDTYVEPGGEELTLLSAERSCEILSGMWYFFMGSTKYPVHNHWWEKKRWKLRCHYNVVNFLQNHHNKHSIARPWACWGWGMECLLWLLTLIYILHKSQCCALCKII